MRKRFVTALLFALAGLLVLTAAGTAEVSAIFSDVRETDWFAQSVYTAAELGLVNGKGKDAAGRDRFDPEGNITLAEAVKLAACMNQLCTEGTVTLKNGDPWYESYADYGRSRFLTASGSPHAGENVGFTYESVMENPDDVLRRAEFAWIFARALPSDALTPINTIPNDSIPDMRRDEANLPDLRAHLMSYYDQVYTLYRAGIINGSDRAGTFHPDANIRRSEVAAIVVRMMKPEKRVGPPEALVSPSSGVTLYELTEANLLSNLMKRHSCVTIRTPGESDRGTSYWIADGKVVSASVWTYYEDGEIRRHEQGNCGDFGYELNADGVVEANLWVSGSGPMPMDDAIASALPVELTEEIELLSDEGDTLTLSVKGLFLSGPSKNPGEMNLIVDRDTLELRAMAKTWTSSGYSFSSEYGYVYDKSPVSEKVMEGWDKTRAVTYEIQLPGLEPRSETIACPTAWDLTLTPVPGYSIEVLCPGAEAAESGRTHVPPGEEDVLVRIGR